MDRIRAASIPLVRLDRKAEGWPLLREGQPRAAVLLIPESCGQRAAVFRMKLWIGRLAAQDEPLSPDHEIVQHTDVFACVQLRAHLYDPLHILSRGSMAGVIKIATELLDDVVIGLGHLL